MVTLGYSDTLLYSAYPSYTPNRFSFEQLIAAQEFFDDERDCARLQAGDARQVDTRDRLMPSHGVENEIRVDPTRCPVGCSLALAHCHSRHSIT